MDFNELQGCNFLKVPRLVAGSTGCGPQKSITEILPEAEKAIVSGLTKSEALDFVKIQIEPHTYYYQKCFPEWETFIDNLFFQINHEKKLTRFDILKKLNGNP